MKMIHFHRAIPVVLTALFFCLTALFSTPALAQPQSARALYNAAGQRGSYLYVGFSDVPTICERFSRSQLMRLLGAEFPEVNFLKDFIRTFPAEDLALLFSAPAEGNPVLQFAWRAKGEHAPILKKISRRTATAEEVHGLFPVDNLISSFLAIYPPQEEEPFYYLEPARLYFTAHDDLLIFGDDEETVKKSLEAQGNRFHRFDPKLTASTKNALVLELSDRDTSRFVEEFAGLSEYERPAPGRLRFEGDISLLPGGWHMDLFSNFAAILYGEERAERMLTAPNAPFFSAGGGKLAAMYDNSPNAGLFLSFYSRERLLEILDGVAESLGESFNRRFGPTERAALVDVLQSVNRVNFAMVKNSDTPGDYRAYALVSSTEGDQIERAGRMISDAIESAVPPQTCGFSHTRLDGWNRAYTMEAFPATSAFGNRSLTLAFDSSRMLLAFSEPSYLAVPFGAESNLYDALAADRTAKERIYVDMRELRKFTAFVVDRMRGDIGRSDRRAFAVLLYALADIRELALRTHSVSHFSLDIRTGWLDFDDRKLLLRLTE